MMKSDFQDPTSDPGLLFDSILLGLLLLITLLWLPDWASWCGMAASVIAYGITAYRLGLFLTPVDVLCIIFLWPVALGMLALIKLRSIGRNDHGKSEDFKTTEDC